MSNEDAWLDIIEARYCYRIGWFFDGDDGGVLGDGKKYTDKDLAKAKADDWDHIAASLAVGKSEGVEHDQNGYFWESKSQAMKALRAAKSALKRKDGKPWPAWAVQADAAGWKPPKGWRP